MRPIHPNVPERSRITARLMSIALHMPTSAVWAASPYLNNWALVYTCRPRWRDGEPLNRVRIQQAHDPTSEIAPCTGAGAAAPRRAVHAGLHRGFKTRRTPRPDRCRLLQSTSVGLRNKNYLIGRPFSSCWIVGARKRCRRGACSGGSGTWKNAEAVTMSRRAVKAQHQQGPAGGNEVPRRTRRRRA